MSWTSLQWKEWQAENMRLTQEGWTLTTEFMLDGSIKMWAEKDGIKIPNDPKWGA